MMRVVVVDIGGTAIKSGMYALGKVVDVREAPTNAQRGAEAVIEKVGDIIETYDEYEAIGISTTGQIDTQEGRVTFAGNNIPGYSGLEIKKMLERRFHMPVFVENDVNAAALGEAYFGAGMGIDNFLCLTYGTGIGGGIVLNGQIQRGAQFAAAEFGGILVHPEARPWGKADEDIFAGCYERYASVTALVKQAKLVDETLENGRIIVSRMQEPEVAAVVGHWVHEVAIGLATLIHIFNPALVLLGGGIMEQSVIAHQVRDEVSGLVMDIYKKTLIRPTILGNHAGMYGMAHVASTEVSTKK